MMIKINCKKLLASAAVAACTLSPVYAQNPAFEDFEATRVVAVANTENLMQETTLTSKSQPVAYDMTKRDKGFLGVLQEALSHVLPSIGKVVKKITPTGYDKYFAD
jgi:hypothetical protein